MYVQVRAYRQKIGNDDKYHLIDFLNMHDAIYA